MFTKVTQQICSKIKKNEVFFLQWHTTTFNQKVQSWIDAVTIDGPQILVFSYLIEFLMQLPKVCLLKSFPLYLGQKVLRFVLKSNLFRNVSKVGRKMAYIDYFIHNGPIHIHRIHLLIFIMCSFLRVLGQEIE